MKRTKLFAAALAAMMTFSFFSCQNESGADYDYDLNNAVVNFDLGGNLLSFDTSFGYADALLTGAGNKTYSKTLAKFAYALAFDCYDTVKVSLKTSSTNPVTVYDNTTLYKNFGFEDAEYVELSSADYLADKDDLTNAVFAHKEVTYGDKNYQIFTMAVQGSSGLAQWKSNFDVGCFDTDSDYKTLSYTHSVAAANSEIAAGTTTQTAVVTESLTNYATLAAYYATEHKGFALAATRIKAKFDDYVTAHAEPGAEKIILLTGHSRGAAITNILGKVFEDDENWTSFSYGFATPRTTTASNATEYKTIFNIINADDLVTELPLKTWGFTRYGTDMAASISETYLAEWKNVLPLASNYVSANGQDTSYLTGVATGRADLYKLTDASTAESNTFALTGFTTEDAANEKLAYLQQYGLGITGYDPYSTFSVTSSTTGETTTYTLSGTFRPQFFLNTLVMGICLASADQTAAATFVMTMMSGFKPLHQTAILRMSSNITGFAYSHAAPAYSILADKL